MFNYNSYVSWKKSCLIRLQTWIFIHIFELWAYFMYNVLYVGKLVEEAILTVAYFLQNITFLYDINPTASRNS